jgi:hypothetical protein
MEGRSQYSSAKPREGRKKVKDEVFILPRPNEGCSALFQRRSARTLLTQEPEKAHRSTLQQNETNAPAFQRCSTHIPQKDLETSSPLQPRQCCSPPQPDEKNFTHTKGQASPQVSRYCCILQDAVTNSKEQHQGESCHTAVFVGQNDAKFLNYQPQTHHIKIQIVSDTKEAYDEAELMQPLLDALPGICALNLLESKAETCEICEDEVAKSKKNTHKTPASGMHRHSILSSSQSKSGWHLTAGSFGESTVSNNSTKAQQGSCKVAGMLCHPTLSECSGHSKTLGGLQTPDSSSCCHRLKGLQPALQMRKLQTDGVQEELEEPPPSYETIFPTST